MGRLKGMGKIFRFTFRQQTAAKGYRTAVVIGMLLCLLLPAGIMAFLELAGDDGGQSEIPASAAQTVYTVDLTEPAVTDFGFLEAYASEPYDSLRYVACEDLEEAAAAAAQDETSLIAVLEENSDGYELSVLLPENTALTETDAEGVEAFFAACSQAILLQKSGLDVSQLGALMQPVQTEIHMGGAAAVPGDGANSADAEGEASSGEEDSTLFDNGVMREIMTYVLTFANIMIIYFLVLFYGQAVANNVVMEKTSKLMDTFLISVRPEAMVFGKVLAVASSSVLQFGLWLLALIGGFGLGGVLVRLINPESDMLLLNLFALLGRITGQFSVPAILVAILIVVAGFFLYCSLAAIGGSLASKTEDLASTNALFSLVLVVSFLVVLYSGGVDSLGTSGSTWQNWVPFMSILVTPARVLLGQTSIMEGIASLTITVAATVLILYAAGRVYRMMALYRGKAPKPGQILQMLKE